MKAYHNSRDLNFRSPFGAVTAGTEIRLKADIWDGEPTAAVLRIWTEGVGETRIDMHISGRPGGYTAEAVFKPEEPALCWYRFEITDSDGSLYYYGRSQSGKGGTGELYPGTKDCPSYQITVSRERKVPEWYKKGIVYQIFPDRFAREAGTDEKETEKRFTGHERGPARRAVPWDKPVSYERTADGHIAAWDFYGGSLKGITEKLGYLKELGVSIIYLNPIFEAASNHRYDTGDYMSIDPVLGTEADFRKLCETAEENGISVIIDGVFNHTGCDSIYFNKYGNYDSLGAYQSTESEYRDMYSFNSESPDGYDSWWGIGDLPNLREDNPKLQELIYKADGSVVRKWMRLGAKGWRLDVADELPDEFIAGIKQAVLEEKPEDALLLGEVWEDASNKESYGVKRKYLQGAELDCVMNYPFRDSVCGFLTGKCSAADFAENMYALAENYPREAFYSNLNLIGSHDRMRIMTVLGNAPAENELSDAQKSVYRLSEQNRGLAKARLWLAALLQMTMPGVPCIYYGDELGAEGYADPYNRAPYPWDNGDTDCRNIYSNAIGVRRSHRIFTDGDFVPFSTGEDIIGYTRRLGREAVTVLINRSRENEHTAVIPRLGQYASDIISGNVYASRCMKNAGYAADEEELIKAAAGGRQDDKINSSGLADGGRELNVRLNRLGSAVIYFSPEQRLGAELESGTGVLCHTTSLPNDNGRSGSIGPEVFRFMDMLNEHGEKYWQILPINPTDAEGSPYAGSSAFAGNISLLPFAKDELAARHAEYRAENRHIAAAADYAAGPRDDYEHYVTGNAVWLDGYAMYCALKDMHGGSSWTKWEDGFKHYNAKLWDDAELAEAADAYRYEQYIFDSCWNEVRRYAESRGISIIGDMPIYVSEDSADAWQYPQYFTLSNDGTGSKQEPFEAGVPPDYFSADGQSWGNPLYRWDILKKNGYKWWMDRLKRAFSLYNVVRLDHFRGFEAYWAIPKGKKPSEGKWMQGPGRELFEKAFESLGPLPVIAEDLGFITPGVRSLTATTGFPGMDVMQFADRDPMHGYTPNCDRIAYTGTHDNETLTGWCINKYGAEEGRKAADKLLEDFYKSDAFIRIVPVQDLMGLDNTARMNVPGTTGVNWRWQAKEPFGWKNRH